jgi:hypothetical protein
MKRVLQAAAPALPVMNTPFTVMATPQSSSMSAVNSLCVARYLHPHASFPHALQLGGAGGRGVHAPRLLRQVVDLDLVVEVRPLFNFSSARLGGGGGGTAPGDGGSAIFGGIECSGNVGGKRCSRVRGVMRDSEIELWDEWASPAAAALAAA